MSGIDPVKAAQRIAEQERDIEIQVAIVDRIDSLLDDEQHRLWDMQDRLNNLRTALAFNGVTLPDGA